MVGVPGRSKGCITCRKRGKGCDFQKPACGVCQKAGWDCAGYAPQRIFIVSTPKSRQIGYSLAAATGSPWPSNPQHLCRRGQPSGAAIPSDLSQLFRTEYESRCIDLFWEAYFPSGRPLPSSVSRSYTCGWTETARKAFGEDDSLRFALWANCLAVTGRRDGVGWMREEGLRMYGKALAELRRSLSRSGGVKRDALIATVKLLSMFEVSSKQGELEGATSRQSQEWHRHHAGELALFVARKPVAHAQGHAHIVFADERVDLAFSALAERKRLVLSTPEWKNVPWQDIPKDLKDVLVDVLVDMPGLLEDLDRLHGCKHQVVRHAALQQRFIQKCWQHDEKLQDWSRLVFGEASSPCKPPPKPPLPAPAPASAFRTHADDWERRVAMIHGMSLYWAICLVLYSSLRAASEPQEIPSFPARTDRKRYVEKLIYAIPILLAPNAGLYGRQSAGPVLELALRYTSAEASFSLEHGLLMEMLKGLKSGNGGKTV